MTASKRGAGPKAGASRASKTFKFRGVALETPKKLPDSISFDLGDIQLRAQEDDSAGALAAMQGLLEDIIGREELRKVRPAIKGLADPWQKDLLEAVLALEGLGLGEA